MLDRLKIGTVLVVGFTAALALTFFTAAIAQVGLRGVTKGVQELTDLALPSTMELAAVTDAQSAIERNLDGLMITGLPKEIHAAIEVALAAAMKQFALHRQAWEAIPNGSDAANLWTDMTTLADEWLSKVTATAGKLGEIDQLIEAGVKEDSAEVQRLHEQARTSYVETRQIVNSVDLIMPKVLAAVNQEAHGRTSSAIGAGGRATTLETVALCLVVVLFLVLGATLTRHINRIIHDLVREMGRITEAVDAGQLSVRGDATLVHFQVKGVVEGMNATLDAYQRPVAATVENLGRIASGNVPSKLSDATRAISTRSRTPSTAASTRSISWSPMPGCWPRRG